MLDVERIRRRIEEMGVTARFVSMRAFGNPDSVRSILRGGQQDVKRADSLRLAAALGVSEEWLSGRSAVMGKPPAVELFDAPAARPRRERGESRELARREDTSGDLFVDVPEYDVAVSAGGGALIADEAVRRMWRLPRAFMESIGLDPARLAFCEVVGDSMMPTLWPGDLILLDLRARNPAVPAIYALWDSDATVVKRVERVVGAKAPRLRLISDNAAFTPYEVPAADVNVIGRVAWFGRRT